MHFPQIDTRTVWKKDIKSFLAAKMINVIENVIVENA